MKSLVIVDVQKEFNKFIQHDLVDELYNYAEKFDKVYQIWDTNKGNISPTYIFPNEVYNIKKRYGKNHFSPKVKKFIKKVTDETPEGNKFKLSDENGYIVRVDNNHEWFYVNPELVDLVEDLQNDKVILVGGADNECLEDIYQMFIAFDVNVKINNKYVYSAKTNSKNSIFNKIKENKILNFKDFNLLESNNPYSYNTAIFKINNESEYDHSYDILKSKGFNFPYSRYRPTLTYPFFLFANIFKEETGIDKTLSFFQTNNIEDLKYIFSRDDDYRKFVTNIFKYDDVIYVEYILKYGTIKPEYKKRNIER